MHAQGPPHGQERTPYLAVELRDRTGAIPGRAFRDADFLAGQFERGDLVTVRGRVSASATSSRWS